MRQVLIYPVVLLVGLFVNPVHSFSQGMEVSGLITTNNPYPLSENKWKKLMEDNENIIKKYEGQKLSSLSEEKRNEYLIALARKCVLVYGPAFYREYKKTIIEEGVYEPLPPSGTKERWPHAEQPYYVVRFPYDTSKELFKSAFIAWVVIMKSDACIAQIDFNQDLGLMFRSVEREMKARERYLEDRSKCMTYSSYSLTSKWTKEIFEEIRPELEKYHLLP